MKGKKNYTFPGFTLIEVVVAMTISGILMTFAVKIIISILSIASSENKLSSRNNEILNLHTVLNENFLNSSKILNTDPNEFDFICSPQDTIKMSFRPFGIIISKVNYKDTIRLKCQNLEILNLNDSSRSISEMSFTISENNLNYHFNFKRPYTCQEIINDPSSCK